MPGMNGGSSLQLVLAAEQQQIGKAHPGRTDVDDDDVVAADVVDIGVRQSRRPGKLLRNKRFHPLVSGAEAGRLRRRQVGDLAPLGGDVVDPRHARRT